MGAKTYELALTLGWPYGTTPTIVLTRRDLAAEKENVELYSGDLSELVNVRLERDASVWVVGGAEVVNEFIRLGLADEIRLSILPIVLGGGTPFFARDGRERPLHLKGATAYRTGTVELRYELRE